MIRLTLLFIFICCTILAYGQQLPQSTQHMFTKFQINPAVAGSERYLEALLNLRYQWSGFQDSPSNQSLSVQGPLLKWNSGLGGSIYNYTGGPVRNTGLSLSYAYQVKVSKESKFSFGLGGVLGQYAVDGSKLVIIETDDPLVDQTSVSSVFYPEFNFGAYVYSPLYYIGLSVLNLANNNTTVFPDLEAGGVMPRSTHINVLAGYLFEVEKDFYIIPSLYANKVINNPLQLDVNIRMDYHKIVQFGMGYRTGDALSILMGVTFLSDFSFFYSYDIQTSKLSGYSNGSHEVTLRYRYFYNTFEKMKYDKEHR